jgi:hypothetical protein
MKEPLPQFFDRLQERQMLQAHEVQAFLRQFEPMKHIEVVPQSSVVIAPWLVKVKGTVLIYGEPFGFETDLDLKEFGGGEDLLKLAKALLTSFAGASQRQLN